MNEIRELCGLALRLLTPSLRVRMLQKLLSVTALAIIMLGFGVRPASADIVYQLNVDHCTGGCLNSISGGTVTLSQAAVNSVTITVQLNSGLAFQEDTDPTQNNDTTFAFNSDVIPTTAITISGLTPGWVKQTGTPISGSQTDGFGKFIYGISCPKGTCASGQSSNPNSVTFTLASSAGNLSPSDFAVTSTGNGTPVFFAADVVSTRVESTPGQPNTGYIGADGGTAVPDGGTTVSLLGLALGVVGLVFRRKK